jgi:hypothetical protein
MKPARLRNPDKKIVRKASRAAVQGYFARSAAAGNSTYWLETANRYRKTATQTYGDDFQASPKTVDEGALIAYIAASAPTHAIDGWAYLARATDAVLRGDHCAALHLGYYAELRAAMSILASEGIGIFNQRHPVIDASGVATTSISKALQWDKIKSKFVDRGAGTHVIVWPILSHWGSLERSAKLIDTLIAPEGYSLRRWLDALGIPRPVRAISKGWFENWGVDLSRLSDDHESRNMVSYRPSEFRLPPAQHAPEAINFVSKLWGLFEPASSGRFPELESELLRKIVRESGLTVNDTQLQAELGMTPAVANRWATFLSAADNSLPLVLAEKVDDIEHTESALQVISRAALLLFLATGSTRKHLVDAGYTSAMLEFFWKRQCEIRFSGPASSLPDDPIDLWQDIKDHIDDAEAWCATAATDTSLGEWRKAQSDVMNQIVSFELAGVWGFVS